MLSKLLRFYYFKYQQNHLIDFVNHGLGIESRFQKFKKNWLPHLKASKSFIIDALKNKNKELSFLVLGAGRLYDFPTEEINKNAKFIKLIDADPSCLKYWKSLKSKKISWQICDITGQLERWSEKLKAFLALKKNNIEDIASFIRQLSDQQESNALDKSEADCIISLNLLSQIGIYWRERIYSILYQQGVSGLFEESDTLNSAIDSSIESLELSHLKFLSTINSKMVILICDDEFYYYNNNQSKWQVEAALKIKIPSELGEKSCRLKRSWLWHLVPQGRENKDYGEIHRVQARLYS